VQGFSWKDTHITDFMQGTNSVAAGAKGLSWVQVENGDFSQDRVTAEADCQSSAAEREKPVVSTKLPLE
jgi:hypothetical protein